tara:strand:+ start:75 stop:926 length:852 start_codon:yes stop_codon:yes gene_type:complete
MKKSELKNIIRESIKELIKEQTGPPYSNFFNIARSINVSRCENTGGAIGLPGYDAQGNPINYGNTYNNYFPVGGIMNGDYGYDSSGGCANEIIGSVTVNGTTPQIGQIIDMTGFTLLVGSSPSYPVFKIVGVGPPCDPSVIGSSFPFTEPDFPLATQQQIQDFGQGTHPVTGINICGQQTPTSPTIDPPNFGCAVMTAGNYDPNADGCETSPGIADPQDASCCTAPSGGQVNFGAIEPTDTNTLSPAMKPNLQVADPIPPVPLKKADPTIDRMKDLAFKGKRK